MKASLASATSVIALLALEAAQAPGVIVTVASTAAGVAAVTLADISPAHAGPITMTGASPFGTSVSTGTLTIYDLVDGTSTSTVTLTFTAKNDSASTTLNSTAFSFAGPPTGTLAGTSISRSINANTTSSASVLYTYRANQVGSIATSRTYTFAGSKNSSATLSIVGSGVAPVASATGSTSAFVLVNNATSGVQVTITNTGNGNRAALRTATGVTLNNLNGSISTISGFSGGGSTLALGDTFGGPANTQTFTFVPTSLTKGGTFSGSAVATFSNGFGVSNAAGSLTATLTGTGVAPVNAVTNTTSVMARTGTSASATVTVSNIGDGNKSGAGTISNLNGTISNTLGTGFTANLGNPTSVSLNDTTSTTLGYTFSPASRGTSNATATFSFSNGDTSGANTAQTITASIAAQGVGPEFQSKLGVTTNTPTPVAGGATAASGPTINFGSVGYGISSTQYLLISNITTDPNGGDNALTNLTLKSFTIAGVDASKFSVGLPGGTVVTKGSSVYLPITVLSTTLGVLNSTLTIFTDQSVALGGVGDTFTYNLTALVPEPTSMAALGAGLAGLALMRRRRQAKAQATQTA